jgi:hypothetical protein
MRAWSVLYVRLNEPLVKVKWRSRSLAGTRRIKRLFSRKGKVTLQ